MKWIKLSDELPPFNKEIVLLSDSGFTRLSFRRTKEVQINYKPCYAMLVSALPTLTIRHLCITKWDCLYQTKLNTSGNIGVCFQINHFKTKEVKYKDALTTSPENSPHDNIHSNRPHEQHIVRPCSPVVCNIPPTTY